MLDKTDREIIGCLKEDAKLQLREIGERVHLTGQAVANRIQRLERQGIIKGYTAVLDENKLGMGITAYITVFMKTADHRSLQQFLQASPGVSEAHRISGDGCYLLKAAFATEQELNQLLDQLLQFGNYRLSISIGKIR
ncbi:AsnC family transcriptional regulator [Hydrogenispora ethanolica]|uniref:AsnC family transcriptional regulator n=1 Tax=Hydrogenispora ethanolica TaxID=1082276 RepID=A0A4R1RU03_HYDET|nr:Lrp/AsnC family transcriptional regulator [Hydrogenispora ethanolica]TCL70033.1 AsnC family transcriptional regulator [Hydrogenispora ethanolica]